MYYALILISFIISIVAVRLVYRKTQKKMISIFFTLLINILFLGTAFIILYQMDIEKWNIGTGNWKIVYLLFAIPIITWFNAFLLQFVKVEDTTK